MPKIILVGVDGSDSSRKAATVAAELAAGTGAVLHVLTAVDPARMGVEGQDGNDPRGDVRTLTPGEAAEAIAAEVASTLTGVTPRIESSPIQGKPAQALVEEAKRLNADLIVVGNRRVQGIGRILGSVAADVSQHAPCDVYIVKTM